MRETGYFIAPEQATLVKPTPALPDQQEFHQYLRELARGGIRVVVEDVMREELDALIGERSD